MIITITKSGDIELREPNDFKGFKVLVEKPGASTADIAAALKSLATLDPDGKSAWVSQNALKHSKAAPQTAEWAASFDKMVDSVKRFGWVNEADGTVRAHIEVGA